MSGGVITITADKLQAVESDLNTLRQDATVIDTITDAI
jgi:hypothetical protein